jgi:hypothetical protein
MWKNLMFYTRAEKQGMVDGVGLFFGALLGTNLGSLEHLSMREYALLIGLLAGAVMSLRIFSTTERRWHGYLLLGLYTVVVQQILFSSKLGADIAMPDRQRLAITLGIWMISVVLAELTPIKDPGTAEGRS